MNGGPQVRRDRLDELLRRAGLTPTAARRQLGYGPSFHQMLNGSQPASPRLMRDLPLLIASRTGIDVESIRNDIFDGGPLDHRGISYLAGRLSQAEELPELDTKEDASV